MWTLKVKVILPGKWVHSGTAESSNSAMPTPEKPLAGPANAGEGRSPREKEERAQRGCFEGKS